MKTMNNLLDPAKGSFQSVQEFSRELNKAGIIEEMMDDVLDEGVNEGETEEIEAEVNKVIAELTTTTLNQVTQ